MPFPPKLALVWVAPASEKMPVFYRPYAMPLTKLSMVLHS
jgi:hypothetical protein